MKRVYRVVGTREETVLSTGHMWPRCEWTSHDCRTRKEAEALIHIYRQRLGLAKLNPGAGHIATLQQNDPNSKAITPEHVERDLVSWRIEKV